MYRRDFDSHCDWAPSKVLLESKNFLRPGDFFLWLAEAAAEPANLQNQMAQKLSQSSNPSPPFHNTPCQSCTSLLPLSVASMAPHNNGVDSGTRSYEISRRKADCKFINSIKCYCSCFEMSLELSLFSSLSLSVCVSVGVAH